VPRRAWRGDDIRHRPVGDGGGIQAEQLLEGGVDRLHPEAVRFHPDDEKGLGEVLDERSDAGLARNRAGLGGARSSTSRAMASGLGSASSRGSSGQSTMAVATDTAAVIALISPSVA
jgi:hypothetical protein